MLRRHPIAAILIGLAVLLGFTLPVAATETEALTMPPAFTDMEEELPPELAELLPDGLFSEDAADSLAAAERLSDWRYLLDAILSAIGLRLGDATLLLATLCALILLAAILARLRESIGGGSGEMFGFCIRLVIYTAIVTSTGGMIEVVQGFFTSLNTLTTAMIPAMGALYAMGGNLGEAAASEELLLIFLAVIEYVSSTVTPPVCALCMSFSLMDAFGVRLTLAPLCEQIKKWYTSLLGLVMFLLSLALAGQSVLTSRADTVGMRGLKYAVGNFLPVVGGGIAGTLNTLSESIRFLRGICGVSGIVLVMLLLAPTLVELLLSRAALRLAATAATLLGCDGEARLLSEMASLYGYLAAAVSICSVLFLLSLTLLVRSGVALA